MPGSWESSFYWLDFGLNIVDGIRRLDFQSDGLACQCLYRSALGSDFKGMVVDVLVYIKCGKDVKGVIW